MIFACFLEFIKPIIAKRICQKLRILFCILLTYSYSDLRSKVLSFEKAKKILLFTHLFVL